MKVLLAILAGIVVAATTVRVRERSIIRRSRQGLIDRVELAQVVGPTAPIALTARSRKRRFFKHLNLSQGVKVFEQLELLERLNLWNDR